MRGVNRERDFLATSLLIQSGTQWGGGRLVRFQQQPLSSAMSPRRIHFETEFLLSNKFKIEDYRIFWIEKSEKKLYSTSIEIHFPGRIYSLDSHISIDVNDNILNSMLLLLQYKTSYLWQ